jgi:hypothetical protein
MLQPKLVAFVICAEKRGNYFLTMLRSVALIVSMPPRSMTSPLTVTVCIRCSTASPLLSVTSPAN